MLVTCAWLPLKVVHWLGSGLGWLTSILPTRARRTTEQNLRLCFPQLTDEELRALVITSLQQTTITALEMGKNWLSPIDKTLAMVKEIVGEKVLEQAAAEKKGVIIVTPHLGNWELLGQYVSKVTPTTFLYKPPRNPYFEKMMKSVRTRGKLKMAPTNSKGVGTLLKRLKQGESVGILPDQEPAIESGEFAPFFGVPALTMTLVAGLTARTGAKVVFGFAERLPQAQGFRMNIYPADPLIYDPDIKRSVEGLNRSVEKCVTQAISQYQWEYKRFKRRPDGSLFYTK